MDAIQSAIAKKEILDSLRPIDPEREQIIMQKFRLDWNYHSNHIEGNSLSYGETKALVLFGITGSAKPLKDYLEVEGHNAAIDWVLDVIKDKHELTENFIRELHTLLLKPTTKEAITPDGKATTRRIEVGQYKKQPNHVITKTGETFRFATPEETPAKMHDLIEWYREQRKSGSLNPILLAAEFHYKFVRIHPFDDGNGRMSRILMNFILMQYGYPPVIIKTENKEEYYIALQQADAGTITPFIEYIAANLNSSLDIMIAGARGESIEEKNDIDKELQLLEQRVFKTTKKVELFRSEAVIANFLDNDLPEYLVIVYNALSKMNKFYEEYRYAILLPSLRLEIKIGLDGLRFEINKSIYPKLSDLVKEQIDKVIIYYTYKGLHGNPTAEYSSQIVIFLESYKYAIKTKNYEPIDKLYNEKISEDELNALLLNELKAHKAFIEQKLT